VNTSVQPLVRPCVQYTEGEAAGDDSALRATYQRAGGGGRWREARRQWCDSVTHVTPGTPNFVFPVPSNTMVTNFWPP
jgi:hypothetical protein